MEKIKKLMEKIDAMSIRERGIILVGVVLVMYTVWDMLFMQALSIQQKNILTELQINRAKHIALNVENQALIQKLSTNPDAANRDRLESLRTQLATIEADVRESTDFLVSPENMAGILRTILSKSSALELVEMKGLGVSPLFATSNQADSETGEDISDTVVGAQTMGELGNAYKHGLKIIFEGNYGSTLNFMREIESLEWGFFWENIEYEVIEYPTGRVSLTLYTLSLDRDWIGV